MLRRVAMVALHTSPLDQPGAGDAGGLNVYVSQVARRIARRGLAVDVFTRRTDATGAELGDGVGVKYLGATPEEGYDKSDLPSQFLTHARDLLRHGDQYPYDLVHAHYWMSGQVGAVAAERWNAPLVTSMHTLARVKNEHLATGDVPEPRSRILGEEQVLAASDLMIANAADEAKALINLYDQPADRIEVIHPGVDLSTFRPGRRVVSRARLRVPQTQRLVVFAGRLQPLKAPDVLLRAAADLTDTAVVVIGSEASPGYLDHLQGLAAGLGGRVRFLPAQTQAELADWFAAADVVCMPSYNESFGLVALEAQACGTPVVAADVGGLPTAVAHGTSGWLVDGHDPTDWAEAIGRLLDQPGLRARLSAGAEAHAAGFGWERTVDHLLASYRRAMELKKAAA